MSSSQGKSGRDPVDTAIHTHEADAEPAALRWTGYLDLPRGSTPPTLHNAIARRWPSQGSDAAMLSKDAMTVRCVKSGLPDGLSHHSRSTAAAGQSTQSVEQNLADVPWHSLSAQTVGHQSCERQGDV